MEKMWKECGFGEALAGGSKFRSVSLHCEAHQKIHQMDPVDPVNISTEDFIHDDNIHGIIVFLSRVFSNISFIEKRNIKQLKLICYHTIN